MGRLDGKVVIITGAAHGMGLSGVKLMAQEGAKVVATDHKHGDLEKNVQPYIDAGGEITTELLDVSKAADWQRVVQATVKKYGTVDVLVNNAGAHVTKSILETSEDDWDAIMNVNAKGVWLGMKYVIPVMMKNNDGQGKGSIINTSSVAALMGGYSDAGSVSYSASKGAVDAIGTRPSGTPSTISGSTTSIRGRSSPRWSRTLALIVKKRWASCTREESTCRHMPVRRMISATPSSTWHLMRPSS